MEILTCKVGNTTKSRVNKLAESKGVTISTVVRELIEQALNRQDLGQALASIAQELQKQQCQLSTLEQSIDMILKELRGNNTIDKKIEKTDFHAYKASLK